MGDYKIKLNTSDGEYTGEDYKNIKVSRIKWEGETSRPNYGKRISTGLVVRDSLAYLTSTRDLVIVDIKNKSNPCLISSFEYEEPSNLPYRCALAIDSDFAYVASGQKGLFIIDIRNPYNLRQVGSYRSYDVNESINDIKVSGDIAYAADYDRGLIILDIYDRSNPRLLGYCPTDGSAEAISVQGNYAYIADGNNGLRIIDISDKSNPGEIGFYNDSLGKYGNVYLKQNIQVLGNYAYISYEHLTKWRCISIIDVSDKYHPTEVACFETFLSRLLCGRQLFVLLRHL